jgi:putative ABC transport system substrate-binding protein
LKELGYVEGLSVDIVYRFAEGHLDRFPVLAGELVALKPDAILATVTPAAVATRALTNSTPIVCPLLADAINLGLIASEARPGGNVTGVSFRTEGLTGKQVELALQMIPDVVKIGFLVNVASGVIIDRQELESTCQRLGLQAVPAEVRSPNDLDAAFRKMANDHVQAVIVLVDGMLFSERDRIAVLAATSRLPAIYGFRDHVDAGGLISYGVNLSENFHRAATYVIKILKGAKPGDLPVEVSYQARANHQQQGRQGPGIEHPAISSCARRRGDRVRLPSLRRMSPEVARMRHWADRVCSGSPRRVMI